MLSELEIVNFVQPHSWDFFTILRVEADWLTWPLDKWEESEDYRKAWQFVTTVKVVNDVAERGIKLASDYVQSLTKDSEVRQKIFQAVEWHRRKQVDTKKSTANCWIYVFSNDFLMIFLMLYKTFHFTIYCVLLQIFNSLARCKFRLLCENKNRFGISTAQGTTYVVPSR